MRPIAAHPTSTAMQTRRAMRRVKARLRTRASQPNPWGASYATRRQTQPTRGPPRQDTVAGRSSVATVWLEGAMEEASEYREHAAECRAIADTLDGPQREQLLRMAQTWDRLAQEHSAPASQPPLVADPDDAKGG